MKLKVQKSKVKEAESGLSGRLVAGVYWLGGGAPTFRCGVQGIGLGPGGTPTVIASRPVLTNSAGVVWLNSPAAGASVFSLLQWEGGG